MGEQVGARAVPQHIDPFDDIRTAPKSDQDTRHRKFPANAADRISDLSGVRRIEVRKTNNGYAICERGLALFSNNRLKDGSRAGSKQILDFTKGFVDAIYAKLLFVEDKDADGTVIKRERRRSANAAMTACRRAWFVGQRAQETKVPAVNPFSRMGLKTRAPGRPVRETPTATWGELVAFREVANKLGYCSVGTAALLTWEWLQRQEHVFGAFEISHYRPKERPNSVKIVHPKNGEEA
jgi:hypothetical protein